MGKKYAIVYKDGTVKKANTWPECEAMTKGVSGVRFKGFEDSSSMQRWIDSQKNTTEVDIKDVINDSSKAAIYVDGSYSKYGQRYAGWAFVYMRGDNVVTIDHGVTPRIADSRNIDGEMYATLQALLYIQKNMLPETIYFVHDYLGISQWLLRLWRDQKETNYVAECKRLYSLLITQGFKIQFIHIKGHKDTAKGNNLADEYATKYVSIVKNNNILGEQDNGSQSM